MKTPQGPFKKHYHKWLTGSLFGRVGPFSTSKFVYKHRNTAETVDNLASPLVNMSEDDMSAIKKQFTST